MNALPNLRGLRLLGAAALVVLSLTVVHACSPAAEQGPAGPAGAIDEAQLASVMAAIDAAIPTGVVLPYAGPADPTQVPAGFLLCNGDAVSRTTYARLFAVVGISHGGGDGTTTFNLPDYRGRFLRGVDAGAGRDPDAASRTAPQPLATGFGNAGDAVGSVQGYAARPATAFSYLDNSGWGLYGTPGSIDYTNGSESGYRSDVQRSVAGGDAETRPVNANVHWIIRI